MKNAIGMQARNLLRKQPIKCAAAITGVTSLALILGAFFFEFVIGLQPCPLCLQQRIPHYLAIPIAALAFGLDRLDSRVGARLLLILLAIIMGVSFVLGGYHALVEWKIIARPEACADSLQALPETTEGLLKALDGAKPVDCSVPPFVFLGLSLAGYNAILSALLALLIVAFLWKSYRSFSEA